MAALRDPWFEPVRFAPHHDALIVPEPVAVASPPGADAQLWLRAQDLNGALGIIEGVAPAHPRLVLLRDACRDVVCAFDASGRLARAADRAAVGQMLERAERELLAVDADVSPDALKSHLDASAPPRACVGGYAVIVADALEVSLARRDRLELLVTRLLTFVEQPGGRVLVETCDESRELLHRLVGGRQLPVDARRSALAVLDEQRQRIEALPGPEALLESGLYGNVYAFKLSLHDGILDFNVLYAIAGVNAAIANLIRASAAMSDDDGLQVRFLAARNAVLRTIEATSDGEPAPQAARFEPAPLVDPLSEVRVVWPDRWRRSLARSATPRRAERKLVKGLITALCLASLPFLTTPDRGTPGFRPVAQDEVRRVAPWVESASLSAGGQALIGAVNPASWSALDDTERKEQAEALARELAARNTLAAVLTSAGRMVVHIENAQVVFVQ